MKKYLKTIILVTFILAFFQVSFGCTSFVSFRRGFYVEHEYLFIGKVVGYTEKRNDAIPDRKIYGLKLEITENINLPKTTSDYYEVFLRGICYTKEIKKKWLKKKYPLNSLVRLSAFETDLYKPSESSEKIRLVAFFEDITRNDLKNSYISTSKSIFDYSKWNKNENFIDFELKKDLFRLQQTESQDDKINILERLAYNQYYRFDYKFVVEKYVTNIEDQNRLLNLRKQAGYPIIAPSIYKTILLK